ncbi:MAG: hypothetical protein AAB874_03835, partial [Patescibacteria group bacterium]
SQAYHPGWWAYQSPSCKLLDVSCKLRTTLAKLFPYIFGERLKDHVLVNNWSNGWTIKPTTYNLPPTTIYIFFWPQLLEFLGFTLLPIPFLFIFRRNKRPQ